jgi:hypothetical protein
MVLCMLVFPVALRPNAGHGLLILEVFWITHNDAPQSVRLLWTSDQLVAETSNLQHTTLTTDKHPCPRGIRTHDLSRRAAADRRLRPRCHWDRLCMFVHWEICIFTVLFLHKLHRAVGMPIMFLVFGTVLTFWQCPALLHFLYTHWPQCQENFYMHHADFPSISLDFFIAKSRKRCGVSLSATSHKIMSLGQFFCYDFSLMIFGH